MNMVVDTSYRYRTEHMDVSRRYSTEQKMNMFMDTSHRYRTEQTISPFVDTRHRYST